MRSNGVSKVIPEDAGEEIGRIYAFAETFKRKLAADFEPLSHVTILVTTQRCGFWRWSHKRGTGIVAIPTWVFANKFHARQYLYHEFAHAINLLAFRRSCNAHDRDFYFVVFGLWEKYRENEATKAEFLKWEVAYKSRSAGYHREFCTMKSLIKEAKSSG